MLEYQARCRRELDQIQDAGDTLLHLEKQLKKAEKAARQAAESLSQARHEAAGRLEEQILTELRQLDMGKIRFAICFTEQALAENGMDQVRFLMSANVGEELRPIHKIASGGELARIMLAMKNVLSEQDQVGTMVFDEVDTGVSGRAAQKVAEKMARISRTKQVLCVTHLPSWPPWPTPTSPWKGGAGGTYLHPGGAAGPCPAPAGAGPSHRRGLHLRHHAGGSRGAAGPGGKFKKTLA